VLWNLCLDGIVERLALFRFTLDECTFAHSFRVQSADEVDEVDEVAKRVREISMAFSERDMHNLESRRFAQPYEIFREAGLRGFWFSDSTLAVAVRWVHASNHPARPFQRFRGHELADKLCGGSRDTQVLREVWGFCFSEGGNFR